MTPERWQEVERLYHAALERGEGERDAFLTGACGGDEGLRREVESLLEHEAEAEHFIDSPAIEAAAKLMATEHNSALTPGETINQYEITSALGAGGMGEVYLAKDTRLRRNVALKLLPWHFAQDRSHLRRFEQEARAVAAFSHPNVCAIYDVVDTGESRPCIVMEYVEGVTLRKHMQGRQMEVTEVLDVAIQVASALSAAHAAGIVHRDIKPENIMLRREGDVKVLDFGLAKVAPPKRTGRGFASADAIFARTAPGVVMGTVHYMSPEQSRGQNVDERTDTWSLGVLLYEMVAGRRPFEGTTATDVIVSIIQRDPVPLGTYAPQIASQLERVVTKALAKDRAERYQTAKDLLFDLKSVRHDLELEEAKLTDLFAFGAILYEGLTHARAVGAGSGKLPSASDLRPDAPAELVRLIERCLAEKPDDRWQSAHDVKLQLREIEQSSTHGTPVSPPTQARRRRRVIVPVAIVMTIAAAVGAIFVARQSASPIQSLAILPLHNASRNADAEYLGDGISDSIITNLSQLPELYVVPRSLSSRFKGRSSDPREVARNLKARAILTGDVAERGDTLAITVELFDAQENTRLWGKQYVRKFTDIFAVQEEIARDVSENLRLKLTPDEKNKLRRRYTEDSEAYRLFLQGQYVISRFPDSDAKTAISFFEQAIQKDPAYAPAYAGLARCYMQMGYFGRIPPEEAREKKAAYVRRALELDDSLAEAHLWAAYDRGLPWNEREKKFLRALALDPQSVEAHYWYGLSLQMQGRNEDAERHYRRAISLGLRNAESIWVSLYQRDCARVFVEAPKALAMNPGPFASNSIHQTLAECLERAGRTAEAVDHYVRVTGLGGSDPQRARKALDAFDSGGMKAFWAVQHEIFDEQVSRGDSKSAFVRAWIELKIGNNEGAIEWLTRSVDAQEGGPIWINVDPSFDPLRGDPRFEALLRRLGYEDPGAR